MDDTLPARLEFLKLARLTLHRLDAEFHELDMPELRTNDQAGIKFVLEDVELSLVHFTDPQIDRLMLVSCRLGPLPASAERETCERLLQINYELSSLFLTGFALDEDLNVVYTYSCPMSLWDWEGLANLIEGITALALQWREGQVPDHDALRALVGDLNTASPSVFA